MLRSILCATAMLLLPGLASCAPAASSGLHKYDCGDWGSFSSHELSLARAGKSASLSFFDKIDACDGLERSGCQGVSHALSPDDVLLLGKVDGHYRCVYTFGAQGSLGGWVSADQVATLNLIPASSGGVRWEGRWTQVGGDDTFTLTSAGNKLQGKGDAYWPLADPPEDQFPNGPNLGAFEASAAPSGTSVVFVDADDECSVSMKMVGDVLVVSDNHQCGGMNVTFDGVYKRDSVKK